MDAEKQRGIIARVAALYDRARNSAFVATASIACVVVLFAFSREYPVRHWLLWWLLGFWGIALGWALSCTAVGIVVLAKLVPRGYTTAERLLLGFAFGVLLFALAVFLAGLAGALDPWFAGLLPVAFLAAGGRELLRTAARLRPLARSWTLKPTPLVVVAIALAVLCVAVVYLPILTPRNVHYDARWYHLRLAEQYAASGAVVRYPEGWLLAAYPQLSSYLYTWAFLFPTGIVQQIEIAAHLEFVVFLATLLTVPLVVKRLLPGPTQPLHALAFFLFPAFLVYDATLSLGADHIAALFAGPELIVLLALLKRFEWRHALLLGALTAGAALTKYSALSLVLPVFLVCAVALVLRCARRPTLPEISKVVGAGAVLLMAFVVLWAPHWLKNWVWYGDPLYPLLHHHLPGRPWSAEAAAYFEQYLQDSVLRPTVSAKSVWQSLRAAANLGFKLRGGENFHGEVLIFGFLFAATSWCLPFSRTNRRVWLAYALGYLGVVTWFWTNQRDRYLQALLPWLVAATAAVLTAQWRLQTRTARAAVLSLVGVQVACGAGLWFLPAHGLAPGSNPMLDVQRIVAAGFLGDHDERFAPMRDYGFADFVALSASVPPKARVLVHDQRLSFGLAAPVMTDERGYQALLDYTRFATAADLHRALRDIGITHVVSENAPELPPIPHPFFGELVLRELLTRHCLKVASNKTLTLWELPAKVPKAAPLKNVLVLGCDAALPSGMYDWQGAAGPELKELAPDDASASRLLDDARFAIIDRACDHPKLEALKRWQSLMHRKDADLYSRR